MVPKILIVDDMPDAIEFLPEWFKREGYDTVVATRGQEALALAEDVRPDVIVLDAMMPGMDGIETCRRLRLNPATANIPVILVSAREPEAAREECMHAGAADYITRPIQFADLLARVKHNARIDHDIPTDHVRLLKGMAYTALTMLPSNLAWILTTDTENRWLEHQTIAIDQGAEAVDAFCAVISEIYQGSRFLLERGANPLAGVVLDRRVLINIPIDQFSELPNSRPLQRIFEHFGFEHISLLPLVSSERVVGVLVLAADEEGLAQSRRVQQILNSLTSQAAMVVDNAWLLASLARREEQVRAEQTFRQLVLDAMGEGLIVVDQDATITYVNSRLMLMTGYSRGDLYGHSVGMLFHPDQRDELVSSLLEREQTFSCSQTLYSSEHHPVPVLISQVAAPSPSTDGQITIIVVTDLSELQRNEDALRIQTQRLQAINHAANAISSASSFGDVVRITSSVALHLVRGETASLLLRDTDDPGTLAVIAATGTHELAASARRMMVGKGVIGMVAETGTSRLISAIERSDARTEYEDAYGPGLRSVLAVPLVAFDEVIGVLEVLDRVNGRFDEHDLSILESFAGSAAITIENMRLFEQTRRRVTELSTLLDASSAVTSTLDFGDILERIARRLSLALRVQRVVIMNWERRTNRLITLSELVNAYWEPGAGPHYVFHDLPLTREVFDTTQMVALDGSVYGEQGRDLIERNASALCAVAGFPLLVGTGAKRAVTLYSEESHHVMSEARIDAVRDVIARWEATIREYEPEEWLSRPNLTDLCQRVLQVSGLRWCAVMQQNEQANAAHVLREMGHALWLERARQVWLAERFPTLARVLELGDTFVARRTRLHDDPAERDYLQRVGGYLCLITPLFIRGESGGLVKLIDTEHEQRVFDNAELSLCQGIANVVGNAMENSQLYTMQEQRASALEAAYKELQDADQMKEDLLQNLSHELRTPLTHILGYLRLMLDGAFGDLSGEQQETLNLVTNKAQHLAELVKDIVSVQDAGAHDLMPKPIHLDRVIGTAIRSVATKARAQGIHIVPRIPADLPLVYADPVRVGEVFEELLENAIKFSLDTTQIEVTVADTEGLMIQASVRDFGIGIPVEEQDKIFRRFYQVESGTTRRFGGTGLGLTIVRQVIEGLNGRVWVESTPGAGSCFKLTLPKATAIVGET